MIADFQNQLSGLAESTQKLAKLGKYTLDLMVELTGPRDPKNADTQHQRRKAMVDKFCDTWSVSRSWVNDLVDMYEEMDHSGQLHEAVIWLSSLEDHAVPQPRTAAKCETKQV